MNNKKSFFIDLEDDVAEKIQGGSCIPVNQGTTQAYQTSGALEPAVCIKIVDGVIRFYDAYLPKTP